MKDYQYRALLNLIMCSDPWPTGDKTDMLHVKELANDEAAERGWDDWVVAYHEMKEN